MTTYRLTDLYKVVNKHIKKKGVSKYKLAQKLKGKVSDQTVYSFLAGKNVMSHNAMAIIAAAGIQIKPVNVKS